VSARPVNEHVPASKTINVRMGEMAVATSEGEMLTAIGLGSCVGLVLVDPLRGIAGLSHVVLPDSQMALGHILPPAKFADTAVLSLVTEMISAGAQRGSLKAVLVGGATMFSARSETAVGRVGPRNVEAITGWLQAVRVPIIADDVGGDLGRTVQALGGSARVVSRVANGISQDLFHPKPRARVSAATRVAV